MKQKAEGQSCSKLLFKNKKNHTTKQKTIWISSYNMFKVHKSSKMNLTQHFSFVFNNLAILNAPERS